MALHPPTPAPSPRSSRGRWALLASVALLVALVPAVAGQTSASVADEGDVFSGPGISVGGSIVPTTFSITRAPGSAPGEVSIGDGSSPAIRTSAAGDVRIPAVVQHDGAVYRITGIAPHAFRGAAAITSTGLAENSSVTSIGDFAYASATSLTATGLEANGVVTQVGTGAFASTRSLRDAALPAALAKAPSIPFTSAANLRSVYVAAPLAQAKRVGLTRALPVYFRSGAAGWDTSAGTFSGLGAYGAQPEQLVPLSSVRVVGGSVSLGAGTSASPYHGRTGLFAGAGVKADGSTGSAAETVTITADDPATFRGWRVTGAQLTPEQIASATVTIPMGARDMTVEAMAAIGVEPTATTKCVAGKAYVYLTVKNTGTASLSLQLTSAYGAKAVPSLAPTKSTSASWTSRLKAMPAGAVTVLARSSDGQVSTVSAPYAALTCGAV
ncbi:leucine-rich repeat protein [Microbacterium sp. Leaf179]|uniref:leucine-rich repeat protein n=1 Tax=Microbacterium sp. Leaf179 TaxID=1736288 RepID=UPI0006F425E5|nr:leucine-rich repeat protein [Microbacterium sp. Leaf179]KQR86380.1 hypothetical protein ASF96_08325 [Microbacterium sp. Leaf179]